MAVAFRAVGALATNVANQTLAVVAPTCQTDDILICCIANKLLANAISPPDATWTQIYQADGDCTTAADDHRAAIYWKRAAQVDSGATFNFTKVSGTNLFCGVISAWSGCERFKTPIDATAVGATVTAAAGDNVSFPAFDSTDTQAHIVYVSFYGNDATTFAANMSSNTDPTCANRWDLETNAGTDFSISCASSNWYGSNIASRTWASSSTIDAGSTGVVFALIPEFGTQLNNYQFTRTRDGVSSSIG